jgi:hypothetical protein
MNNIKITSTLESEKELSEVVQFQAGRMFRNTT